MKRLLTKTDRENRREAEFTNLLSRGYKQQTCKGLEIFTRDENGRFYLQAYQGTAAKPCHNYYHSTEESRAKAIEKLIQSQERIAQYKAELKANPTKSSAANCSAAIKEKLKQLYPHIKFSVKSENFSGGNSVHVSWEDGETSDTINSIVKKYQYGHFDSMYDIYESSNSRDDIPQVKYTSVSRNMSKELEAVCMPDAERFFTPDRYRNCRDAANFLYQIFQQSEIPQGATVTGICETGVTCGTAEPSVFYRIAYTLPEKQQKPQQTTATEQTASTTDADKIQVIDYSEKAIAVTGNFSAIYDKLIAAGGKYNKFLKCGRGIIFSKKHLETVIEIIKASKQAEPEPEKPQAPEQPLQQLQLPAPAETTLRDEITKTVQFFADTDVNIYGGVTKQTQEIAKIQKVNLFPEVQEYDNLNDLEQAAKSGKVVSLYNMAALINQKNN